MAAEEQLVFDSLTLNDATFGLAGLSCPPPRERPEWIGAADSEAQLLSRAPKHENRDITVKIQVAPQASMDLALAKVALLVDKCVKASKYPDGLGLTWTAATGTITVTFDVLSAEIVDLPIDWESGWLAYAPTVTIVMKAKPYWRGTETLTSTTSSSTPFVTAELVNSIGDVPALGRLIVTDTASQSRRHVEWGLEGPLTYNSGTSLIIDSDNLVTSGFAGTGSVGIGAYDPNASGNSQVEGTVRTAPVALCGTGNLSHVGVFRVKARVASSAAADFRLAWQAADGPFSSNAWAAIPSSTWSEIDLGTISISAVLSGTQRWTGRVEARTASGTATAYVDYLVLVPVSDGYGKARATYRYQPGVTVGFDDFTGTTAAAALNARVAVSGGTWATSGTATDFTFFDPLGSFSEGVTRATTNDAGRRFAVLGSTNYTDTEVYARTGLQFATGVTTEGGLIARWVDSSNYLAAILEIVAASGVLTTYTLKVEQRVAGVSTVIAQTPISPISINQMYMRLVVFASGTFMAQVLANTTVVGEVTGSSTAMASGGALDDGKPGLLDRAIQPSGSATPSRYYDDFTVATPVAEPIVIYSGRNMQIRHEDVIRQDSTGTYTGRPPTYRGSRFLVPVGTSRVLVKARRNDVDVARDDNVTDATQVQIGVTPRGLVVPRS